MSQVATKTARASNLGFSSTPAMTRLVEELAVISRNFNRSEIIRTALIEKADRDLPANWREVVGLDSESAA